MGRVLDIGVDVAYDHEGYAAWVLDDGTLSGTASVETDHRKTGKLRAVCGCGWTGPELWDVDSDDPADWPSDALEDDILADWEAHVRGLVDAKRSEDVGTLLRVLRGIGGRLADDIENTSADALDAVLSRAVGELTYAAELAQRSTREDA